MGLTFIKSLTASSDCELSFIDGTDGVVFDSTYNEYQFRFVNLHPSGSSVLFQFQVNATNGADFNDSPITSTYFEAYNAESGAAESLDYTASRDAAQSTSFVTLAGGVDHGGAGNDDGSASGIFTLYDPSSTTFVKHWVAQFDFMSDTPADFVAHTAGYINTGDPTDQPAIDEIRFQFNSGDIDAGTIYMYGVG